MQCQHRRRHRHHHHRRRRRPTDRLDRRRTRLDNRSLWAIEFLELHDLDWSHLKRRRRLLLLLPQLLQTKKLTMTRRTTLAAAAPEHQQQRRYLLPMLFASNVNTFLTKIKRKITWIDDNKKNDHIYLPNNCWCKCNSADWRSLLLSIYKPSADLRVVLVAVASDEDGDNWTWASIRNVDSTSSLTPSGVLWSVAAAAAVETDETAKKN